MSSVSLRGLEKLFGAQRVIAQLDLEILDQEFVTLVGPSGCGKSTLLRMIAGLETPTGGDIFIDGRRVNEVAPMHRDVAMVFQSYALYPHMSVYGNMSFGLRMRGRPRDAIPGTVAAAAQALNLGDYLERRPAQLSGGQRQRVAMGRAMVRAPKLFLFDEPLSNLDAKLRVHMRTEIKALHRRLEVTSVYVTHDQIEAMTMADRIVVLNAGRIEQIGTPEDLYDRPRNIFVAGFIGSPSMNMLAGTVAPDGGFVLDGGARLDGVMPPAPPGQALILGVRPEHVSFGSAAGAAGMARVDEVQPTGADTIVVCGFAGQTIVANLRDYVHLDRGSDVPVGFAPTRLRWFDAATGSALQHPGAAPSAVTPAGMAVH
jgi:multiple sugar transport system ATP-binding protein